MIGLPLKLTIIGATLLSAVGIGGYLYFVEGETPAPRLDPLPELVYGRVVEQIVAEIAEPPESERILIPPVAGDSGELRLRLRDRLNQRRGLEVVLIEQEEEDESPMASVAAAFDRWRDWVLTGGMLEPEEDKPGADLLLVVQRELEENDSHYRLTAKWQEGQRKKNGEILILKSDEATAEVKKSLFSFDYLQLRIGQSSRPLRLGMWLAVLIIPPFLLLRPIRSTLKQESNLQNGGLVLLLTVPAAIVGWILCAFGSGWVGGSLTLLGILIALCYSFVFLTVVEEYRR